VLQRVLSVDTATQVAGRAFFAMLAVLAYVAITERGSFLRPYLSIGRAGIGVALCLTVASGAFITALNHTTVARVLLFQAVSPVLAALLARALLGEPIGRRTGAALAIALAGIAVMLGSPGRASALGDGLALVMSLAFGLVLVITRHRRDVSMAPATGLSQLILFAAIVSFARPDEIGAANDLPLLAVLGGQVGLGLVLLTLGTRLIPAVQVGLISLLEVVLGPVWVWMGQGEHPDLATLVGGTVVITAILIQTGGRAPHEGAATGDDLALPRPP
jgi:drug/metabolite transporter (DMT)-like permease